MNNSALEKDCSAFALVGYIDNSVWQNYVRFTLNKNGFPTIEIILCIPSDNNNLF
jgi:hypothetical protein